MPPRDHAGQLTALDQNSHRGRRPQQVHSRATSAWFGQLISVQTRYCEPGLVPGAEPGVSEYSDLPPRASAVLRSLRAVGYDVPTSIADIIDNSLAVGASAVAVDMRFDGTRSYVRIVDNGTGMDASVLDAAMRLGSQHPDALRAAGDHGRFGLGLKTASFGQCRRLTVRSRPAGGDEQTRSWDLDHVERLDSWALRHDPWDADSDLRLGHIQETGTIVLWEKLDRVVEDAAHPSAHEDFDRKIAETVDHLGMVFHRLIDASAAPVTITVNGRRVHGWDPLLSRHQSTRELAARKLQVGGVGILVVPYIIPPESRLSPEDARRAAGPHGWLAHQGFYLYRNRRLLVTGGWLGLARRDPQYSRARIRVDVDNRLDDLLRIDIRKARARVPDQIREPMRVIAEKTREEAARAWSRNSIPRTTAGPVAPVVPIWHLDSSVARTRLRVNATHPAIRAIRERLGEDAVLLDALLKMVAAAVPVDLLLQSSGIASTATAIAASPVSPEVCALTRQVVVMMRAQGLTESAMQERLAQIEPWSELGSGQLRELIQEAT